VLDEAGHHAGMCAQHENEAEDRRPGDGPAHGYRSFDVASIQLRATVRVAGTAAKCPLLARVAFPLETRFIELTILKLRLRVFPSLTPAMHANLSVLVADRDAPHRLAACPAGVSGSPAKLTAQRRKPSPALKQGLDLYRSHLRSTYPRFFRLPPGSAQRAPPGPGRTN
jgi:hypothetical protein